MEAPATPAEFRAVWDAKPVLRAVYSDYYRRIAHACVPGPTVEIGAGSGNLKEGVPGVFATDIVPADWLDAAVDAQAMPFTDASIANVVGVDVLHHVEYPRRLLGEVVRVLRPDGRLVLIEPAITPVSWLAFKLMHPEPVDLRVDPLADGRPRPGRDPFDSNQALPTLLTGRHRDRTQREFPELRLARRERLSLIAYPLSGGFRRWSLVPERWIAPTLRFEQRVAPALAPLMGFRLFLVFERRPADARSQIAKRATVP